MLLDFQNAFCDNQIFSGNGEITSDNVIVFPDKDITAGNPIPLIVQIVETFTGNFKGLKMTVQASFDSEFEDGVENLAENYLPKDELYSGNQFTINAMPRKSRKFVRLLFNVDCENDSESENTIEGSIESGAVTAGIVTAIDCGHHSI